MPCHADVAEWVLNKCALEDDTTTMDTESADHEFEGGKQ